MQSGDFIILCADLSFNVMAKLLRDIEQYSRRTKMIKNNNIEIRKTEQDRISEGISVRPRKGKGNECN